MTEGLGQVESVTQSNTSTAEESAAAAEELSSQAQQLISSISVFRLGTNGNSQRRLIDGGSGQAALPGVEAAAVGNAVAAVGD